MSNLFMSELNPSAPAYHSSKKNTKTQQSYLVKSCILNHTTAHQMLNKQYQGTRILLSAASVNNIDLLFEYISAVVNYDLKTADIDFQNTCIVEEGDHDATMLTSLDMTMISSKSVPQIPQGTQQASGM